MIKILSLTHFPLGNRQKNELKRIYGNKLELKEAVLYHQSHQTIIEMAEKYDILALIEEEVSLELQHILLCFFAGEKKVIRSICSPYSHERYRQYDSQSLTTKRKYKTDHAFWDELISIDIHTKPL